PVARSRIKSRRSKPPPSTAPPTSAGRSTMPRPTRSAHPRAPTASARSGEVSTTKSKSCSTERALPAGDESLQAGRVERGGGARQELVRAAERFGALARAIERLDHEDLALHRQLACGEIAGVTREQGDGRRRIAVEFAAGVEQDADFRGHASIDRRGRGA